MGHQYTYRIAFARYPAVRLVLLFAAGIAGADFFGGTRMLWGLIVICSMIGYAILEIRQRRTLRPGCQRKAIGVYLLMVAGAGGLHYHMSQSASQQQERLLRFRTLFTWQKANFHGRVSKVDYGEDDVTWTLQVDSLGIGDSLTIPAYFKMRVRRDNNRKGGKPVVGFGDYLGFRGKIYPIDAPRNPHQFDYAAYLQLHDILLVAGAEELLYIRRVTKTNGWLSIRRYVHDLVEKGFSDKSVPLAKAILIGEKTGLSDHTRKAFARTGLAHVMAVSGMHVGFVVAPFWLLIPWFWRFKRGKILGLMAIGVLLLAYAGITGFSASVVRASLTAVLLAYGKLFHRRRDSINLTATAALILLVIDPGNLFRIGFQLSFAAVFTILMVWPLLDGILLRRIANKWWHWPFQLFLLSLLVQIGLLPFLARYFGEVSIVGPFINLLVVAFIGLIVQTGLAGLFITGFSPVLGQWLLYPVNEALHYLRRGVEAAAEIPWSWIEVRGGSPFWFALWIIILLALASAHMPYHRWKWWGLALIVLCLWQINVLYGNWRESQVMRITALDVGQGDAVVVQTPDDKTMLIDAGRWSPKYNSGSSVIIPYLEAIGVDTLDAVVLTHPHADHIGGMEAILDHIPVGHIYHPGSDYTSDLYQRIQARVRKGNVKMKTVKAGQKIALDASLKVYVLAPVGGKVGNEKNVNDASVILRIQYGKFGFLFMGDAGRIQERGLIDNFYDTRDLLVQSNYLKVGHHGSNTSSSGPLLEKVKPSVAVVSVGVNNRYRHPHPEAVERLRRWTTDSLHFTSRDRAVVYESDGESLRLINWDNRQF